ncbi:MAG: hypothetical protein HN337_05990 [Deltaproteobacteria bacterium]|jgi:hypothetical protein|nr:hypothetical protein [Deltaproteobacteria bacterium]
MYQTVKIGPYEISSSDPFISSDDVVVNTQTDREVSPETVAQYLDTFAFSSNSEMGSRFRSAISNNSVLFLEELGTYYNENRKIECDSEANSSPLSPNVKTQDCELFIGDVHVPLLITTEERYNNPLSENFVLNYGGTLVSDEPEWTGRYANCHSYSLSHFMDLPKNASFNDIPNRVIHIKEVEGEPTMATASHTADDNGFEKALDLFYRPVGVINSKDVPIPAEFNDQILAAIDQDNPQLLRMLITEIDSIFGEYLSEMVSKGQLDPEKAGNGTYVFVMGHRLLKEHPGGNKKILWAQHSGRLYRRGDKWFLRAKSSFSEPVIESELGSQVLIQHAVHSSMMFPKPMFFRIYEPALGLSESNFDMEASIEEEPAIKHPFLFQTLKLPKVDAYMFKVLMER